MKHLPIKSSLMCMLAGALLLPMGCTWRTEHRVETVHKIDAHIVLDIRQQASQIEDYVRTEDEATTATNAGDGVPTSHAREESLVRHVAAPSAWSWLIPVANAGAQEVRPSESGPVSDSEINAAKQRRKERYKAVDAALSARWVGEDNSGYLSVVLPKDAEGEVRRQAVELARAENRDRGIIYRGLAHKQDNPRQALGVVEKVFAAEIREKLKKGQMFQTPKDEKMFQSFKESRLGKAHESAKPDAWVVKAIDPPKE